MRRMHRSTELLAAAFFVAAAALPAGPAAAQAPGPAPPAAPAAAAPASAELADLRDTVEERYDVLPSRDGLVLVPRDEVPGIRSIEVTEGEVAINGEAVSPTILRSWLGEEADPLLALADLELAAARELFGPLEPEAPAEAPAAPDDEDAEDGEELVPPSPEPPRPPREGIQVGERFSIGSGVVVEGDEIASEAVSIGGGVRVLGVVEGDAVAIGGSVTVEGEVEGEVVAVGGHVRLGPNARVGNGITTVGGRVDRAEGAIVEGEVTETGIPPFWGGEPIWRPGDWVRETSPVRSWEIDDAFFNLLWIVVLALLVCLALLIARGVVERSETRVRREFWIAGLVGLATQLLCIPVLIIVTVVLVITVVGCLALPLIPIALLALFVAAFFGYAAVALALGRHVLRRFGRASAGLYLPALLGVGLIEVWRFLGEAFDIVGGPAWVFALMFGLFGALVEYVAWTVGLGALIMGIFSSRQGGPAAAGALPPPPPTQPYPSAGPAAGPAAFGAGTVAGAAAAAAAAPTAAAAPPAGLEPPSQAPQPGASTVEATRDAAEPRPAGATSEPPAADHAGEGDLTYGEPAGGGLSPESAGVPAEAGEEGDEADGEPPDRR